MRSEFPSVRAVRRHQPLEFLQLLKRRTGILVEIDRIRHKGRLVPAYEFRNLTFQEYLAGLALVEGRFPSRNREKSLAENVSPLAAQTSESTHMVDLAVTEHWREALRLCVMSCNDDDVDGVLLAIADVREDEDPSVTARPRAALAISCLSDEPNVSEDIAIRLIDRFIGVLEEGDGVGVTVADRALKEVGGSLWGPHVARRIVMAWTAAPEDDASLGACASLVVRWTVPRDEKALQAWLADVQNKLSSDDGIDRICAALGISRMAHEG
jgi:hypothetical protein